MKHLRPIVFLAICLSVSIGVFSQTYKVDGTIRDSKTNQPIISASIILNNGIEGTSTNDQGLFKITFREFPAVLFLQSMGYIRDTVVIENEDQYNRSFKNQNRVFLLNQASIQIREVQVKATSTLFEKDPYAIIDYKIVGKRIVALGFRNGNEFRKELLVSDLSGKMISNHTYKGLDSLFQDCQENIFAFCADSVLELQLTHKEIAVRNAYQRPFIMDFILPVCGITDSMIMIRKSSFNHQYDNYFAVRDSQYVQLIYSTGGLMKEREAGSLKRTWTQQSQVPITMQPPEGCTGGCINAWLASVYEPAYHRYFGSQFTLMTDFRPVFTKALPYGKHQLIFDREAATIYWLDAKGQIIREVGINNKLYGIYFQDVHLDTGNGRIYVEYPQGTFTHFIEINPETGQEIRRFMVRDYHHIENCKFLNDRLYFLYQPDTGKRIKKIYSIWI